MYFKKTIYTREELLSLAYKTGEALRNIEKDQPWIVLLGADADSGKSIIALGIDEIFNPDAYPDGILSDHSADMIRNANVVFENYRGLTQTQREGFDRTLAEFEEKYPDTKALIACNIERTVVGNFNYRALGLCSDMLDLNIDVQIENGTFTRKVGFTTENQQLAEALSRFIPSAPLPPA